MAEKGRGRRIHVVQRALPGRPDLDTAVSRATLLRVAAGELPETLRLYRPDAVVAFGRKDTHEPGFAAAVAAARGEGFGGIVRLAGGRAAVFHEATLAFAWAIPDPEARTHVREHFDELAGLMVDAFRDLGVDARVGEVAGEYCPGSHSVNARGERKLMGVGQRIVGGGTHVGGVIVVGGSARVRRVLGPVYAALELPFEPGTVGSLEDEIGPLALERVEAAILARLAREHVLVEAQLDPETLARAEELAPEHRAVPSPVG